MSDDLDSTCCKQVIRGLDRDFLKGIVVSNSIPQAPNKEALNTEEWTVLNVLDISSIERLILFGSHYKKESQTMAKKIWELVNYK